MAAEFDAERRVMTGNPTPIADEVGYTGNEYATFSVSQNGLLVFQPVADLVERPIFRNITAGLDTTLRLGRVHRGG